jgi:hypothetical protein
MAEAGEVERAPGMKSTSLFRVLPRRRRPSAATVSVHVRDLAQLLNSLDPSPFWDRDLDSAAAEFIEDEFSDRKSATVWHLHVYAQAGTQSARDLQMAVENYYGRLAASARRALREHLWMSQLALLGGVAIFLACMGARSLLTGTLGFLPPILGEGLIILAWLALWRPAESLVYGWIPLYRQRRLFERLADVRVSAAFDKRGTPGPQLEDEPVRADDSHSRT